MKMKEVMKATNLPEKTIRYYEERGLVTPKTYRQNMRTYHDYSEEDVEVLKRIVILRQAQFTLDEIYAMEQNPDTIQAIVAAYHNRIREAQENLTGLLHIGGAEVSSVEELCREIQTLQRQDSDYVPVLRFGQGDPESEAERAMALSAYKKRQEKRFSGAQTAVVVLSIACAILLCVSVCLYVIQLRTVSAGTSSTAGWTYYTTQQGILREKEGQPPECVYRTEYSDSFLSYIVDTEKLYVMDNDTLFSINADGSGKHVYPAGMGGEYLSYGNGYYGVNSVFLLHGGNLYVALCTDGAFSREEYAVVRIPVSGGKQEVLNLDLNNQAPKGAAIWKEKLYLFLLAEDKETLDILVYDLKTDVVVDRASTSGSNCYYFGDSVGYTANTVGGTEGWYSTIYQISPDNLSGTELVILEGDLISIHGHYALYAGDFSLRGDENSSWMEPQAAYLYNLETGNQIEVALGLVSDRSLNWTKTGLYLTSTEAGDQFFSFPE